MSRKSARSGARGSPVVLMVSLVVFAGWVILVGVVTGVLIVVRGLAGGVPGAITFMTAMGWVGGGASLGCLLLAGAWLIWRAYEAGRVQRSIFSALTGSQPGQRRPSVPVPAEIGEDRGGTYLGTLSDVLKQLRELNANVLLTDEQRELKRRHRQWQIAERIAAEAEQQLAAEHFAEAEQLLERLINEVPDDPRYKELSDRLAEARTTAEAETIHSAMGRAEDLLAAGSFEDAEKVAAALLERHPSSAQVIALLDRVRRERETFTTGQRRRLYDEVDRHAAGKRWRAALSAAKRLLEGHPNSAEADAVAPQIPALKDNARIEEVRELRDVIRDLLGSRRYKQAIGVAEQVMHRFPETKAAAELRGQMPKLKELAKSEAK